MGTTSTPTTTTLCSTMPTTTTPSMLRLNNNKTTECLVKPRWQYDDRKAIRQDDPNINKDANIKRTNDDNTKSEDKLKLNSVTIVNELRLMRISTCKLF